MSGKIDEWLSTKKQTSNYAESVGMIISPDIEAAISSKPDAVHYTDENTAYLSQDGSHVVTGINYKLLSFNTSYTLDKDAVINWLGSNGLVASHMVSGDITKIPFNNYFAWKKDSAMTYGSIYFSAPEYYNNPQNSNVYYSLSIGSCLSYGYECFYAWIRSGNLFGYVTWAIGSSSNIQGAVLVFDDTKIKNTLGNFTIEEIPEEEDPQKGIASIPIGWAGDTTSKKLDEITLPDMPSLGISSAGFVNVYKIDPDALKGLAAALFHNYDDENIPTFPDGVDNLNDVINIGMKNIALINVKSFNLQKQTLDSKYIDYVIDCHILPVSPTAGTNEYLSIGGRTIYKYGKRCTQDYVDVSCGSITIPKYYDNFNDVTGCNYKLYLPFIGYVTLNPSYCCKGSTITVKYRFNIIDGSCMAFVSSSILSNGATSIIGVYSGSCCVHMPITGANYNSMISGMLNIASMGVNAVKNPMSLLGSIGNMNQALDQATHPSFDTSNGYNASSSFIGIRYPYMLIERPTQTMPSTFFKRKGAMLMSTQKLSNLKGFVTCVNADTSFSGMDNDERQEIKSLLESGIFV